MNMSEYSPVAIRYADGDLSKHNFVKVEDFAHLEEENEILRNERNHWYHMYNQASAPDNEMPEL